MKIVITGAKGQLGSALVEQASQTGFEVCSYTSQELDITQALHLDLTDVDAVVNCAAYTAVDQAEETPEPAFAVNAQGVKNLALLCRRYDVPLIHLSTDYVFDGAKQGAYLETDQPNPLNQYGASKLKGEQLLQATWEKHIILRASWVFSRFGHNFVKTILRLAQERPQLKIVADQIGAPTAAPHIAQVIIQLLQHPDLNQNWGIYHYTDAPLTSWYEFAKCFVDPAQCELIPITSAEYPVKARRPLNSALDCNKIERIFGIKPQSWQDSLEDLL